VRVVPSTGPLRRSTHNRIIAGVCAGIAEWRGWRPVWVRVAFVVGSILPIVPGFVVYVVLWLIVPKEAPPPPAVNGRKQ
jgi:phage shock protein C